MNDLYAIQNALMLIWMSPINLAIFSSSADKSNPNQTYWDYVVLPVKYEHSTCIKQYYDS